MTLLNKFHAFSYIYGMPWAVVAPMPSTVIIEITNRCDLRCPMCYRENLKEIGDMSFGDFKTIVDQLDTDTHVCIGGTGEPFIHDRFFDMHEYCRVKGFNSVMSVTNGNWLDDYLPDCLKALTFSIDATDKETYEKIRVGANYDRVIANLKMAVANGIDVSVNTVVMPVNYESIMSMPEFIVDISPDIKLNFQTALEFTPYVNNGNIDVYRLENSVRDKCTIFGITFKYSYLTSKVICSQIFTDAFIDFKGNMTPCCLLPDKRIGNVIDKGLFRVWNGGEMRSWRKALLDKRYPEGCQKICHMRPNDELAR